MAPTFSHYGEAEEEEEDVHHLGSEHGPLLSNATSMSFKSESDLEAQSVHKSPRLGTMGISDIGFPPGRERSSPIIGTGYHGTAWGSILIQKLPRSWKALLPGSLLVILIYSFAGAPTPDGWKPLREVLDSPPPPPDYPFSHLPPSWLGHQLLSEDRFTNLSSNPTRPVEYPIPNEYVEKAMKYAAAVARLDAPSRSSLGPHFDPKTGRRLPVAREKLMMGAGTWQVPDWKVSELNQTKSRWDNQPVQWRGVIDVSRERVAEEKMRREFVKRAFQHGWEGYKRRAWGHDEVGPVSGGWSDNYNSWAASCVDNLDTLLIMGLSEEYDIARELVAAIDFGYLAPSEHKLPRTPGQDISPQLPLLEDMELPTAENSRTGWSTSGRVYGQPYSPETIPYFETVIRFLGGLISAYDLSGDPLLLERAIELGDWLLPSMNTDSGMPVGRYTLGFNPSGIMADPRSCLAEAGSLTMEFTRLSMISGDETYYRAVQRLTDVFDTRFPPGKNTYEEVEATSGRLGKLLPSWVMPHNPNSMQGEYTFGAMADSYYEYLLKMSQLLSNSSGQYARMYSEAIDSAYDFLIRPVEVVPDHPELINIGYYYGIYQPKLEHLTCFSGGMLSLGSALIPNRTMDRETGQNYTKTCVWAYNATASGLMPESLVFYDRDSPELITTQSDQNGTAYNVTAGTPPGAMSSQPGYIGRPEAIESVFYQWRMTGDRIWQDRGWDMFTSWMASSITEFGFASVENVHHKPSFDEHTYSANWKDSQESFVLAETLKYYYLLFADRDLINLDDYVFNTEAHPMQIPRSDGSAPLRLWKGLDKVPAEGHGLKTGQGTLVQQWARLQQAAAFSKQIPIGT